MPNTLHETQKISSASPALVMALALSAVMFSGAPAGGQQSSQTTERLKEVEREIEKSKETRSDLAQKADAAEREIAAITAELVKGTAAVQDSEQTLTATEARITDFLAQERAAAEALDGESQKMAETLAALQRLGQRPPELLLARPGDAVDTVRSATLLRAALPELQNQAAKIRSNIENIEALRKQLADERADHMADLSRLQTDVGDLNRLKSRRQTLRRSLIAQAEQETRKIGSLATEAKTLRELLDKIERSRSAEGASPANGLGGTAGQSFASARGALPAPARGLVVSRFGAETPTGASKGIRFRTRPGAQVIAPFDGRVVFAGPFRSYGQLLIIGHGEGYHTLLAGMTQIDAVVGQWLLAGEPVGIMGATEGTPGGQTVGKVDPELYLEIRRNGNPINPLPWIARGQGKVGG